MTFTNRSGLRPRPPCGGGTGWGVAQTVGRAAAGRAKLERHGATPLPASPTGGEETRCGGRRDPPPGLRFKEGGDAAFADFTRPGA